jgi:hypothetical protein
VSERIFRGALGAALLIGVLVGCSEQVTGSIGCPELCADQSATLRDTILLGAIVVDTSFSGFPRLGEGLDVNLINRGDTADVRLVTRFDSLPTAYVPTNPQPDSTIQRVDSASLIFLVDSTSRRAITGPLTIDAFDVDSAAANDTIPKSLLPLFRPDRLIGSQTFQIAELADTMKLTLNGASVLAKIKDSLHLRIGLRVRQGNPTGLLVLGSQFAPRVRFRVSTDTTVHPDTVFLRSLTPANETNLQIALNYYPIIAAGELPPPPVGKFVIGGIAGSRSYLRFDIPNNILDSVQIIRASLLLNQTRARSTGSVSDSVTVYIQPVLAAPTVTDIFTAATFLGSASLYGLDTVRIAPRDSGIKSFEIVKLLRFWSVTNATNSTHALVLRSPGEGNKPGELSFFSLEAPTALRPRLRITYVPRRGFGIP